MATRCQGKVAVVTGRPIKDCYKFLDTHGLRDLFTVCICMEDAPAKPDPTGVLLACSKLGMKPSECLMIGDTPDDIKAGKAAGTAAWGVITPEEEAKLILGLIEPSQSMSSSLVASGADGVMSMGISKLLDLVAPVVVASPLPAASTVPSSASNSRVGEQIVSDQ